MVKLMEFTHKISPGLKREEESYEHGRRKKKFRGILVIPRICCFI